MCASARRSKAHITEGLLKHVTIFYCCKSYLKSPETRIKAELESRKLLTFWLEQLKLDEAEVTLVLAEFVWTEPHSRKIKSNLDTNWVAAVQLWQHVPHQTFFYPEQLILKHDVASNAVKIKRMDHGFDIFFFNKLHGVKSVEFISKVAPIRSRGDRELVRHGLKNTYTHVCNFYGYKLADQYWRSPFSSLLSGSPLVDYVVLDINNVNVVGSTYALADAQVARVSDIGRNNDIVYHILGHLLSPGDYALGYHLYGANFNNLELDTSRNIVLPEVILVKKSEKKRQRKCGKPHTWKFNNLDMEVDDTTGILCQRSR